jgi:N-acetylglucosamine-6-sulfatase
MRRNWFVAVVLMALSCLAAAQKGPQSKPNIIVVLTDDLDRNMGTMDQVSKLKDMIAGQGITFSNSFVSESLCCPSRSSIQRGQYVHNHQVLGNHPPDGGFEKFHSLNEESSTIGTWVKAAGYRTGFMGKYLNGYPDTAAPNYVPPGWDDWVSPAAGNPYSEYNYTLNENGNLVQHADQPQDYLTDVLSQQAADFLQKTGTDHRPFFLFVATYAPHQPATPAPRHQDAFPDAKAPRPPSYNEADVSDKPAWIQARPLLTPQQQNQMDNLYRKRLQSLLAVQDLVQHILDTLKSTKQLDNTYIIFESDNGFHLGEHRLHAGKLTPYEEDIRVPLYVRGPGIAAGRERKEIVGNIDIGPTVAELAGAQIPDFVDGRSLVPLFREGDQAKSNWRGAFLIEQEEVHFHNAKLQRRIARRHVLEPFDPLETQLAAAKQGVPAYSAIRTPTHIYVVYSTGERELYDLNADPYELDNIVNKAGNGLVQQLDNWLNVLKKCSGAGCRTADVAAPH